MTSSSLLSRVGSLVGKHTGQRILVLAAALLLSLIPAAADSASQHPHHKPPVRHRSTARIRARQSIARHKAERHMVHKPSKSEHTQAPPAAEPGVSKATPAATTESHAALEPSAAAAQAPAAGEPAINTASESISQAPVAEQAPAAASAETQPAPAAETTQQAVVPTPAPAESAPTQQAAAPVTAASSSDAQVTVTVDPASQPAATAEAASPAPATAETQAPATAEVQTPAADQAATTGTSVQVTIANQESPAADQAAAQSQEPQGPGLTPPAPLTASADGAKPGAITEEELRHMLVGKSLYLRGGYLDNSLSFDENGRLTGHSPQGSYTLSGIEVDKVRLTKHKVELEGARFALHFLGALPYEDPTKAVDRVKITPKKKYVKITIDRELVVTPKKKKGQPAAQDKNDLAKAAPAAKIFPALAQPEAQPADQNPEQASAAQSAQSNDQPAGQADAQVPDAPAAQTTAAATKPDASADGAQPAEQASASTPAAAGETEPTDADQAKAEMAAAPQEERPADPGSVTTTTSPAHAAGVLKAALDKVFAPGLDDRMLEAMPDFWKLYYQAVAARTDYKPKDSTVLRQSAVDEKAKLLAKFEPESNDFAQNAGVAGMCLYHAVIGPDGKPGEISVARPIGFGLDEQAVAAIRKASFQPAVKNGQPVSVVLDLVVQFRIYSKRTSVVGAPEEAKVTGPILPGPYTLQDLLLRSRASNDAAPQPQPGSDSSGAGNEVAHQR